MIAMDDVRTKDPKFEDTPLRLTLADFIKTGLLTADEVATNQDINRVIVIEDKPSPTSGSITTYDNYYSNDGIAEGFNRKTGAQPKEIKELTIEAHINTAETPVTAGFFLPKIIGTEKQTYFTLTVSARVRNLESNSTKTQQVLSATAIKDPEDDTSFIVQFTQNIGGPVSSPSQTVKNIQNMVNDVSAKFSKLRKKSNPEHRIATPPNF